MAETKNQDESTFAIKRKLDPVCEEDEEENDHPNKTPKVQSFTATADKKSNSPLTELENTGKQSVEPSENDSRHNSVINSSVPEAKISEAKVQGEENNEEKEKFLEEDVEEEEDEDEDEDEDDYDDNGEAVVVDRKGKGIMMEKEGDDNDDDSDGDDSSDDVSEFDSDDSELDDDPLAEVDLDNILSSRTRRKVVHPDFNIAHDDGEDDDSDDSDA